MLVWAVLAVRADCYEKAKSVEVLLSTEMSLGIVLGVLDLRSV